MKKTFWMAATAIGLVAAAVAANVISGDYNTTLGYLAGKDATGDRATAIGAGAAGEAVGVEKSTFVGAASGTFSSTMYQSTGIGYRSLRNANGIGDVVAIGSNAGSEAVNCEDCIFIGKNAGTNAVDEIGTIDIGGVFKHKNGVTTIAGYSPAPDFIALSNVTNADGNAVTAKDVGALPSTYYSDSTHVVNGSVLFTGSIIANNVSISGSWDLETLGRCIETVGPFYNYAGTLNGGFFNQYRDDDAFIIKYVDKRGVSGEIARGDNAMYFKFENGGFSVYTNGVKAGTLNFTPATD